MALHLCVSLIDVVVLLFNGLFPRVMVANNSAYSILIKDASNSLATRCIDDCNHLSVAYRLCRILLYLELLVFINGWHRNSNADDDSITGAVVQLI